jgi:acyl dehydratase
MAGDQAGSSCFTGTTSGARCGEVAIAFLSRSEANLQLNELAGADLGSRNVAYGTRDAILYALSVGAPADRLDLIYERDLRVLPTYACALGLWAVEQAGELGAYDRKRSLHVSQRLVMHRPMPREGAIAMRAGVESVWDKRKASIVNIAVQSDVFTATYTIFLPGVGNWGGSPGPSAEPKQMTTGDSWRSTSKTSPDLAALYRLTGDLHPIHIDSEVARANGFERPILHGLCTLGIAARVLADAAGAHPCDLRTINARLSAPVMPGDVIAVSAQSAGDRLLFEASVNDRNVLTDGEAVFAR